jgi:hypothetical protein
MADLDNNLFDPDQFDLWQFPAAVKFAVMVFSRPKKKNDVQTVVSLYVIFREN